MYEKLFFLLLLLKFFVFDFRQFYYSVSWRRSFGIEILGWLIPFMYLDITYLSRFEKFSAIIFLSFLSLFPFFPSGTPVICRLFFLNGFPLVFFHSFLFFFYFCSSYWIILNDLSLSLLIFLLICVLSKCSIEFIHSIIIFFSSKIFSCFYVFIFSISLLNFSYCFIKLLFCVLL